MLYIRGLNGTTHFALFNSIGRLLRQGKLPESDAAIDMSGLAGGWYMLELQNAAGQKQRVKIVKQ